MLANANVYTDVDGVLCIEIAGGFGDAIKLRTAGEALDFLAEVSAAVNAHFGMTAIANDLARQTLDLPPDCDRLTVQDIAATPRPLTRDELRAANEKALDDIAAFASGKLEIHY